MLLRETAKDQLDTSQWGVPFTWIALGMEDLLEEGMATHSSILAWRIPWTEEAGYSP